MNLNESDLKVYSLGTIRQFDYLQKNRMNNNINYKNNTYLNNYVKLIILTAFVGGFWGVFNGFFAMPIIVKPLILLFFIYFVIYKSDHGFITKRWQDNFITIFFVCVLTNFISCWINRKQSILESIQTEEIQNMFLIFFFYILLKFRSNVSDIEKSIVVLYTIFISCFFLQYFIFYPIPVFRMIGINSETLFDSHGNENRFRLLSQMIGFIGYFFSLNKILTESNKPIYYYCGVIMGLVFIILLGFRGEAVAVVIASLYMIYRVKGIKTKMVGEIVLFVIVAFLVIQIPFVHKQIDNMLVRQMGGQTYTNEYYIRNVQLYYFLNEHSINPFDFFFGSGMPSWTSEYGKKWYNLSTTIGSYGQNMTVGMYGWVDWGIIGLSWMMGIPLGLLLYGFMLYMIFKNYGKRYMYISSLYLFLLLTSFTTIEFYRQGAYIYHALILYLTLHLDIKKTHNYIKH